MFAHFRHLSIFSNLMGLVGLIAWIAMGGCATKQGPELLVIPASQYESAFDVAVEVARAEGMPAAMRDRRSGVIETEAQLAGSLLEPWRNDNATFSQATENTLAHQRRRARFEFVQRHGTNQQNHDDTASGEFALPPVDDLTQTQSDLELRVWVYVERANTPGLRRSTWTRQNTTRTKLIAPEGQTGPTPTVFWTPVARDADYERRLLASIEATMAKQN